MYSVKDLDIDVRKTQCHPSLTIQELFIDVHQKLLLDQETRLRKKALRRRPFPKTGPAQAQESKHAVSVLRMMHMLRDGSTAGEVYTEFRNQSDSLQGFLRQTFISELQKPGGGVLTMDFCTMGMFILDSVLVPPPRESIFDILGGAGTYAVIGARFFRKPPSSRLIGSIVHVGPDLTSELVNELLSWKTHCILVHTPDRPTTRGVNMYFPSGKCSFEYLTDKIQIEPFLLDQTQLCSKTFHLICTPKRCIDVVKGIMDERKKSEQSEENDKRLMKRPIFVWEPLPSSCKPSELDNLIEALRHVDVVSPNLSELNSLFEEPPDQDTLSEEVPLDENVLKRRCNILLAKGFGIKPSAVVVRLGERGCYVAQLTRHIFLPPYHRSRSDVDESEQHAWTERVADPTGGGNAFLGGYCIGLLTEPNYLCLTEFEMAALYGSVAASFVIEQFGMPKLSIRESDGQELWNGESAHDRMNKYERRLNIPKLTEQQLQRASLYADAKDLQKELSIGDSKRMVRKNEL